MNSRDQWKCGACGSLYDEDKEALECCAPTPIEVFLCGECKGIFETQDEADLCCDMVDDDGEPIVTAEMLEAAGQLRLPLPEVSP